jgi:hypothetical protein
VLVTVFPGQLAGFLWQAASLASRPTEPVSVYKALGVSFPVNALVSLDGGRVDDDKGGQNDSVSFLKWPAWGIVVVIRR